MFAQPIVSFRDFVQSLGDALPDAYLKVPHSRIVDAAAFGKIQDFLVDYYTDVESRHSFVDANGSVFDCIPIHQQFSLRGHGGALPRPPTLPSDLKAPRVPPSVGMPTVQLDPRFTDQFGNRMEAPQGTIPVLRLTLEALARFPTLDLFLTRAPSDPSSQLHQWATAQQTVANVGGGSILNLWNPQVGPGQLMSLSQIWLTAGQDDATQTVEAGWQVNPTRYGDSKPILFVFWTADNYTATGSYNLTCAGFVQTSRHWMLGGAFPSWSTLGGPQCEIELSWFLKDDRWWLFIGGEPLGYFPVSVFRGGDLAKGSAVLMFGGEAATTDNMSWPAMGSGNSPVADEYNWGRVAYQRQLHFYPPAGGRADVDLDALDAMPVWCFNLIKQRYSLPWGETIWFGGEANGEHCAVDVVTAP